MQRLGQTRWREPPRGKGTLAHLRLFSGEMTPFPWGEDPRLCVSEGWQGELGGCLGRKEVHAGLRNLCGQQAGPGSLGFDQRLREGSSSEEQILDLKNKWLRIQSGFFGVRTGNISELI